MLDAIGKAGATFRSLADSWADTTTAYGRLMLTVLGGLAQFERDLIKARTNNGRKRAMVNGVRFGRPVKLTPYQRREAIERHAAGESLASIGKSFNVSHQSIMRVVAAAEAANT
jgi:DNA invertase Pin-like site-specific DNA recombinase